MLKSHNMYTKAYSKQMEERIVEALNDGTASMYMYSSLCTLAQPACIHPVVYVSWHSQYVYIQ